MYTLKVITEEKFKYYPILSSRYKDLVLHCKHGSTCITDIFVYDNNKFITHFKNEKKGSYHYGL